MSKKQIVGIIGSGFLFVGVFCPLISAPIVGNVNYFMNGKGDGVFIIVLVLISLLFIVGKRPHGLLFTGLASLALIARVLFISLKNISELKSRMAVELDGNPFGGLAAAMTQSVQLQWGWAILIIGAVLLIVAEYIREDG